MSLILEYPEQQGKTWCDFRYSLGQAWYRPWIWTTIK